MKQIGYPFHKRESLKRRLLKGQTDKNRVLKVSVYHILNAMFSVFQIDLIAIFHLKKSYEKKINSKQSYKQKTFLCINYLLASLRTVSGW